MDVTVHFKLMAKYNSRMNLQILNVIEQLDADTLLEDKGAFFHSILGSLNHILVGDIIWLSRFYKHSPNYSALKEVVSLPKPSKLNDILYPDLNSYKHVRQLIDGAILTWLNDNVQQADFERDLTYSNTAGVVSTRNFSELVSHLFNHQTHHRGQVSTLLNQLGHDIGSTDYLIDIPDKQI